MRTETSTSPSSLQNLGELQENLKGALGSRLWLVLSPVVQTFVVFAGVNKVSCIGTSTSLSSLQENLKAALVSWLRLGLVSWGDLIKTSLLGLLRHFVQLLASPKLLWHHPQASWPGKRGPPGKEKNDITLRL